MGKRKLRNIVSCLLAVTLFLPTATALAGTGNDVSQSGSNFSYTGGSGSGGTNKYATYDGGVKVSFLLTSADGESHYKPDNSKGIMTEKIINGAGEHWCVKVNVWESRNNGRCKFFVFLQQAELLQRSFC